MFTAIKAFHQVIDTIFSNKIEVISINTYSQDLKNKIQMPKIIAGTNTQVK